MALLPTGWNYPSTRTWTDHGGTPGWSEGVENPRQPWNDGGSGGRIYGYKEPDYIPNVGAQHMGMDIRESVGSNVFSIGAGTIHRDMTSSDAVNSAFVVRHTTSTGTVFYAVYGHTQLRSGYGVGRNVSLGEQIGTIASQNNGHIHFGIKMNDNFSTGWGRLATGLDPNDFGWMAPRTFLLDNSPAGGSPPPPSGVTISSISDNRSSYAGSEIPRFFKLEVKFSVGGVGTAGSDFNPFNPRLDQPNGNYWNKRGILVDALIEKPDGTTVTWPCFWKGDGSWYLRFSPTEVGTWTYQIQVKYQSTTVKSAIFNFNCAPSSSKGFVRKSVSDPRMFELWDGSVASPITFFGTGTEGNVSPTQWVSKHQTLLPLLSSNGANYVRLFSARGDNALETYGTQRPTPASQSLNKYDIESANNDDSVVNLLESNGIYFVFMLDDWTYFKGSENSYIASGCCSSINNVFAGNTNDGLNNAREIYKRKIRYALARWGHSRYMIALEMMNECYGASPAVSWHQDMGNYILSLQADQYTAQPHLATTSLGSSRLRESDTDWDGTPMSYVNYHDYARLTVSWTKIEFDDSPVGLEKLGSNLSVPYHNMTVWIDRIARLHYKRQHVPANGGGRSPMKPLIWEEGGLIRVDSTTSDSGWGDQSAWYSADTQGEHVKDLIWAGAFALMPFINWKSGYLQGNYPSSGGVNKYWIFKPLTNFFKNEDLRGMIQETFYSTSDPINPNPGISCSNASNIQMMALRKSDRALVFLSNLTHVWYRLVSSGSVPSPSNQSATVQVKNLSPGTYTLETYRTDVTDPVAQKTATTNIVVGSNGIAQWNASLGTSTSNADLAYKLFITSGGINTHSRSLAVNTALSTSLARQAWVSRRPVDNLGLAENLGGGFGGTPQGGAILGKKKSRTKPNPGTSLDRTNPLTKGLTACLPFWEGNGEAVIDLVTKRRGSFWSARWVEDESGGASIYFDSTKNARINLNGSEALKVSGTLSVAAWVRPDILPGAGTVTYIVARKSSTSTVWWLGLHGDVGGRFHAGFNAATDADTRSDFLPETGKWYHVVCTFDQSDGLWRIYVNGEEQGYTTQTAASGTLVSDPSLTLVMGNVSDGGGAFDGEIGSVFVWDRILTQNEIRQLYLDKYGMFLTTGFRPLAIAGGGGPTFRDTLENLGLTATVAMEFVYARALSEVLGVTGLLARSFSTARTLADSLVMSAIIGAGNLFQTALSTAFTLTAGTARTISAFRNQAVNLIVSSQPFVKGKATIAFISNRFNRIIGRNIGP